MPIEIHLNGHAIAVALITGGTTLGVACVKAASNVAVAWIQASHGHPPFPEIEPPDP
jgi:hypothetical protein